MSETVLVTGASSGIGRELAIRFARSGHNLVLVARSESKLNELRDRIVHEYSVHVEVVGADLSEVDAGQKLFDEINRRMLVIDVLVNNAGFGELGRFGDLPLQRQMDMIRLNVLAVVQLSHLLLPEMLKRKRGGVLNVASTAAFQPGPNMAIYYATKAFVLSFSEALHEELANTGLHVTCLAPGPTQTGFANESGMDKTKLFDGGAMDAGRVAQAGFDAFQKNRPLVVPGFKNRLMAFSTRLAPRWLVRKLVKSLQPVDKS